MFSKDFLFVQFLNAVALTPVDIEVRQSLRNEYKKVGLDECIEYLKTRFAEGNQVRSQVEVYLEEAGYDDEEKEKRFAGLNVDLNDVNEIIVELQKRSKGWSFFPLKTKFFFFLTVFKKTL